MVAWLVKQSKQLDHPAMRAQAIGLLAISAVLLTRSNVQFRVVDGWEQLAREAESMSSRVPR